MNTNKGKEEKCYLEYVEGHLTCTYNHKAGEECLMHQESRELEASYTDQNIDWENTYTMKAGEIQEDELVVPINIVKIILSKKDKEKETAVRQERERVLRDMIKECEPPFKDAYVVRHMSLLEDFIREYAKAKDISLNDSTEKL